jgi:hypothetical protein
MFSEEKIAENLNALVQRIEEDIAGPRKCSLMSVLASTEGDDAQAHVPFTYTIGLSDLGWPELIIAGVAGQNAGQILNAIVDQCLESFGAPVEGVRMNRVVQDFPVRFQSISDAQRDEYMRWAVARQERVNGPPPRALQVVFPDPVGLWPDDPECEAKTVFVQQLPTKEQLERVQ